MAFAIGDQVTLSAARGGWTGFIVEQMGGPVSFLYRVQSPNIGNRDEGMPVVDPADISAGPLAVPQFTVGQSVTLYGMGGTVQVDNGDDTYRVDVDWFPNRHMTLTRQHQVPAWRLALENTT